MAKNNPSLSGESLSATIAKINEKSPYLIVMIVAGAIAVFFYYAFFETKIKETTVLGGEIRDLHQTLDETHNNLLRIGQYQQEVAKLKTKIEKYSKRVKSREDIPSALESLSRLASENGVKIEQMMPDEAHNEIVFKNAEGNFIAIPVVIGAKSGYHDFGRLINKLEDAGLFVGLRDFGIVTNASDSNQHQVKLVLNLVIFEKADNVEKPERKHGRRIQ